MNTQIVATGFHIGLENFHGGRIGDEPVSILSESLHAAGIELMRFKTGTCARLNSDTIDYAKCEIQHGDQNPQPFSFETKELRNKQVPCFITYTNKKTHEKYRKHTQCPHFNFDLFR